MCNLTLVSFTCKHDDKLVTKFCDVYYLKESQEYCAKNWIEKKADTKCRLCIEEEGAMLGIPEAEHERMLREVEDSLREPEM